VFLFHFLVLIAVRIVSCFYVNILAVPCMFFELLLCLINDESMDG